LAGLTAKVSGVPELGLPPLPSSVFIQFVYTVCLYRRLTRLQAFRTTMGKLYPLAITENVQFIILKLCKLDTPLPPPHVFYAFSPPRLFPTLVLPLRNSHRRSCLHGWTFQHGLTNHESPALIPQRWSYSSLSQKTLIKNPTG